MTLNRGRQFAAPTLPGMEGMGPKPAPKKPRQPLAFLPHQDNTQHFNQFAPGFQSAPDSVRSALMGGRGKPVGMRGTIGDRQALTERMGRQRQGEERWNTYRQRMEEDDEDRDNSYDEQPENHPRTGLPSYGPLNTHHDIGFEYNDTPHAVSFHGSAASARTAAGNKRLGWVPTPYLGTAQSSVSSSRVHGLMEDESSGQNPRIPRSVSADAPHVYHDEHDDYTIIDGNHRASADMLQGRLFTQAHVIRPTDIPDVRRRTIAINTAKARAGQSHDADKAMEKLTARVYGEDY